MDVLREQYELVKESRTVLLDYCSRLSNEDFLKENSAFGRGSIRNLLIHIANTYQFWLGEQALKKKIAFTTYQSSGTIQEATTLFHEIDKLVFEFLEHVEKTKIAAIEITLNGQKRTVAPVRLFTHVITHEFHHKGQILSLSRHLGYIPVDTDVMR